MSCRPFFINDVQTAVRDNLEGLVAVNSFLRILKKANIVVRFDYRHSIVQASKVALISGGGSGHEPSHAGFVGLGLLTASVSGNIFASPTADEVLTAIKLVTRKNGAGTLLIVPNYTGDRLHFGSAKERAVLEGYNVEMFVFGDDCVFAARSGRAGARGLAGVFFIHKIAGALAESGTSLRSIMNFIESAADRIASISISLGPCNVPGVGPSFVMPPGQLEVGLGIHGERGSRRISYVQAQEAVSLLIDHLTSEETGLKKYFLPDRSTRIALLFNDNGGMTTMEMNVVIREAVSQFTSRGFTIERTFSGRYVTSFDMIGFCISMIVLNDEILKLLDERCGSVIISQGVQRSREPTPPSDQIIESTREDDRRSTGDYNSIDRLHRIESKFVDCIAASCKVLIDNESHLNQLDSESGDSDCGSTLAHGARKIMSIHESGQLKASFLQLSHIIESSMGGTSGALFSLLLTGASAEVASLYSNNPDHQLSLSDWPIIIQKACDKMTQYSYAKSGDRTLVDPLVTLVGALRECQNSSESITSRLTSVIDKVKASAQFTASMVARIGRASYTPRPENQQPDPGAWAIYLIVDSIIKTYLRALVLDLSQQSND